MFKSHRILILCQDYPSEDNPFSQPFIHSRVLDYIPHFDVTVLNFSAKKGYSYQNVNVITEKMLEEIPHKFELLISHAPNLRNHVRLILNNQHSFERFLFTFHGYEIINIVKRVYKSPKKLGLAKSAYHVLKLPLLYAFLRYLSKRNFVNFIFVSENLLREATEDLKAGTYFSNERTRVIWNKINPVFHQSRHEFSGDTDFICLRPFDDPKYGVDLYLEVAKQHPEKTFHLYGKGKLDASLVPANVKVFHDFVRPENLPSTLNNYRAAILPTRWDSQGVLACEIAEFGMPLYTSDLSVCREFLNIYQNVKFVKNSEWSKVDLDLPTVTKKTSTMYGSKQTTGKEIELIQRMLERISI